MNADAVVIGGGFYGAVIALHLRRRGLAHVVLAEREGQLCGRASYANQARVHTGHHYPRSFMTAYRSRINMPRFCADYDFAVVRDFTQVYAVAARRSKVSARQFEQFLTDIGSPVVRAPQEIERLFAPHAVQGAYVAEEYAIDAVRLRQHLSARLAEANVDVRLHCDAQVGAPAGRGVTVTLAGAPVWTRQVFNCTYARINHAGCSQRAQVKHELAELALIKPPPALAQLGITVMDGPFFSCMPFPAQGCHSLSHVRYTPQDACLDLDGTVDPDKALQQAQPRSLAPYMLADARRLLPCMAQAQLLGSLFEIKTVLQRHEVDDGRPILFLRAPDQVPVYSVLGGKLDNIYDVLVLVDEVVAHAGQVAAPAAPERAAMPPNRVAESATTSRSTS